MDALTSCGLTVSGRERSEVYEKDPTYGTGRKLCNFTVIHTYYLLSTVHTI